MFPCRAHIHAIVKNRVLRWKQKIQEFSPIIQYIQGQDNLEADALSCLPIDITAHEIMWNHPPINPHNPLLNKNQLDLKYIHSFQEKDLELTKAFREVKKIVQLTIKDVTLIHHQNNELGNPRIVIPHAIQYAAIRWIHSLLGLVGISRLSATFQKHFWFPHMTKAITQFVHLLAQKPRSVKGYIRTYVRTSNSSKYNNI